MLATLGAPDVMGPLVFAYLAYMIFVPLYSVEIIN